MTVVFKGSCLDRSMNNQATTAKNGKGNARMKNPSKPPRFSKNTSGGTQSQVCYSKFLYERIQRTFFNSKDNPNFTQGGTISQPYPISQGGLMSQPAYGLSQQDFSQSVRIRLFSHKKFVICSIFECRICMMCINHPKMNIINCFPKILLMLIHRCFSILKSRTILIEVGINK